MTSNPLECKVCTGPLEIRGDQGRCTYCGEVQPIPKANESLFNRANRLRCENKDFDAAMRMYEQIVLEWPNEAEAYWGLVLCRYGIEYVADNGRQVPTCHRTILASILEDTDYRAAVDHAEGETRAYYEKQGRLIDTYQKKINLIAAQERPYDVFISFKANGEDGATTDDSFLAQQLFNCLTQKLGLRVFFSKYTLEDKAGSEYEPIIFAALSSARVMVLVGTRPEYLRAPWVKNEWSRFLGMMNDPSVGRKWLIPALKGMKPTELPTELSRFQAVDLGGFDAINELSSQIDLRIGAERVNGENPGAVTTEATARAVQTLELNKQIEAGDRCLSDGEFSKAIGHFSRALEIDPTSSLAYWGRFLAGQSVTEVIELFRKKIDLSKESDFRSALRFAKTPAEKGRCEQLLKINDHLFQYARAHGALIEHLLAASTGPMDAPSSLEVVEAYRTQLRQYQALRSKQRRKVELGVGIPILMLVAAFGLSIWYELRSDYVLVIGLGFICICGIAYFTKYPRAKDVVEAGSTLPKPLKERAALDASFERVKAYVRSEIDRNNREFVKQAPNGTPPYFVSPPNVLDAELDAAFVESLGVDPPPNRASPELALSD